MDSLHKELDVLESVLDGREKPSNLSLSVLKYITDDFSQERKIGHGGCGEIYKGILQNGTIAVKKLFNKHTLEDKQFNQEAKSMIMIEHRNIVRFIGYCSNTEQKVMKVGGRFVMAEIRERLLCFEYISNGSLDNYLTDELRGQEWHIRYKIIKGICEGLHHLHKEKGIIHMDLKPANILLDDHMIPKIADFGLSRPVEISNTLSDNRLLSPGYCAPEYRNDGKMSLKSDIYSLGVIITEVVTGSKEEPDITNVLRRWRHRWNNRSTKNTMQEYHQVSKCIELALSCLDKDPLERPFIWDIIDALDQMENANPSENTTDQITSCLEDMLGIEPLELHLPFEPNKRISCSIQLTNNTNHYFAFRIQTTNLLRYWIQPVKDVVPPRSKYSVTLLIQAQEQALKYKHRTDLSVQSTRVDDDRLTATDITKDLFREKGGLLAVDEVNLTVVFGMPSFHGEEQEGLLSDVPRVLLDKYSQQSRGAGEESDEPQLFATKDGTTSSQVIFPLTLWLGLRRFVQRRSIKKFLIDAPNTMVSPTVYARRSLCHLMCDRPDAALCDAIQAQVLYPDGPTACYMQAVALLILNMHSDAIEMLNMAAELEERRMSKAKS